LLPLYSFISVKNITKDSKILDFGCGNGNMLFYLNSAGYKNLQGVDPFIKKDIVFENLHIHKKNFSEISERFDLITSNHSFEHVTDPKVTLRQMSEKLNPGGQIMIRVPVVDSTAWEKYGINWFQIDAPRHFYLYTRKVLIDMGKELGLDIVDIINDSTSAQFMVSEYYKQDISIDKVGEYQNDETKRLISLEKMAEFEAMTNKANNENLGDQIAIIYRKK
jgi:cyclopropane fatty-acyl-phospholipid synthase-like methyltransferase